jgi:hypothetical protein
MRVDAMLDAGFGMLDGRGSEEGRMKNEEWGKPCVPGSRGRSPHRCQMNDFDEQDDVVAFRIAAGT